MKRADIQAALSYAADGELTLATGIAELHHRYVVISPEGAAPVEGEAVVTGPGQELPPDVA